VDPGGRAATQRRAARHLRRDRAGRVGCAAGIGSGGYGRVPPGARAHRGTIAPRVPAPDLRVQDGRRVPGVSERPPDALSDAWRCRELALRAASGRAVSARRLCRAAARCGARRGADAACAGAGGDRVRKGGAPTPLTPGASPGIERLSLNQITTERASLAEAVEACARHGVPYIAVWRHKLAETGLDRAVRLVRDAGLRVSSVCRGGR